MYGLNPQTIGQTMPHGYAGSYARQPDMIVNTRPAGAEITFGAALKYDESGAVVPMGAGDTAENFVGVASREVKSALSYLEQNAGSYAAGEAVPVFQRGTINVKCAVGTPKLGGKVCSFPRATKPISFLAVPPSRTSVSSRPTTWAWWTRATVGTMTSGTSRPSP